MIEVEAVERITKALQKAEEIKNTHGAYITICKEQAIERTQKLKVTGPWKGPLFGYAISVKDNICTKGIRTTAGSIMLANYVPPFNATVIEKIENAGGTIIGKTSMDTFGFGTFSTNVGDGFPVPRNPFDKQRSAGGSSGGSGVATALFDKCDHHLALAQSTGGSITAPASFCGVVGFTPSYGRVSRFGLIDYANTLDKIGTMGKTAAEAELLASVIIGDDSRDSTAIGRQYSKISNRAPGSIKIGVIKEMLEGVDQTVLDVFERRTKKLESNEMIVERVSMPSLRFCVPSYYVIATAEASTNLAKFNGLRYGKQKPIYGSYAEYFSDIRGEFFSAEEKRRIILGTFVRTAGYRGRYYVKAMRVREKIIFEFEKLFRNFDCLISPSMPILPPKFDEIESLQPHEIYALDRCTIPPDLAGIPHLSIPTGMINNLPTGLQLMCAKMQDEKLFSIGKSIEAMM